MIRRSWTRAASIEETLALWAASLRDIKKRTRPLFRQDRVATNAGLFLEGLLGDGKRKTGWMRAEAAGDPGPWRQQAIRSPPIDGQSLTDDPAALRRARRGADQSRFTKITSRVDGTAVSQTPTRNLTSRLESRSLMSTIETSGCLSLFKRYFLKPVELIGCD